MQLDEPQRIILDFMARECTLGHFEFTIPEINRGVGLGRTSVILALERLTINNSLGFREKGIARRVYHLRELLNLWRGLYETGSSPSSSELSDEQDIKAGVHPSDG